MCKIDNEDYYSDYKWVEDLYRKVGEFIDMINRASPTK